MGLTDIFSIPFLICLAICILLIGCSSIYFYQRILQQDHKIASMVSLISSMTEEHINREQVHSVLVGGTTNTFIPVQNTRITVSDDEDSDSDSESDSDSNSDSDEEDSDEEEDHDDDDDEDDEESHTKNINLHGIEVDLIEEMSELDEVVLEQNTTKSIHLVDSISAFDLNEDVPEITTPFDSNDLVTAFDSNDLKSISISGGDLIFDDSKNNYKKMSISKLREAAQPLCSEDISKLKKNEILKLLGIE